MEGNRIGYIPIGLLGGNGIWVGKKPNFPGLIIGGRIGVGNQGLRGILDW